MAGDPIETAFSTKKEKNRRGNLKNAKAFSGGARFGFAKTGGGACAIQHFSSK
jgi:hypothetical protein